MVAAQLMDQLVKTQAERNALRHEVADLRAQVEWFKRNLFGQGKSETFDALQTRLKFDDEVTQPEVPTAPKEQIHYERSKPTKRKIACRTLQGSTRSGNNGIDPRCSQSGSASLRARR